MCSVFLGITWYVLACATLIHCKWALPTFPPKNVCPLSIADCAIVQGSLTPPPLPRAVCGHAGCTIRQLHPCNMQTFVHSQRPDLTCALQQKVTRETEAAKACRLLHEEPTHANTHTHTHTHATFYKRENHLHWDPNPQQCRKPLPKQLSLEL